MVMVPPKFQLQNKNIIPHLIINNLSIILINRNNNAQKLAKINLAFYLRYVLQIMVKLALL